VTLKNDETLAGVLKTNCRSIGDQFPQTGLKTINKKDIQARQKSLSRCPKASPDSSKQDIRNLVEFLSSLK